MIQIQKLGQFAGHKDCIYALGKSQKDNHFYTGAADGYIVEWSNNDKSDGVLISRVSRPVYSFLLDSEKMQLFVGTAQGSLHCIDLNQQAETRNIEAHTLGLYDLKAHQNQLISVGGDGVINIWDLESLQLVYKIKGSEKSARCLAIQPNEKEFAVGFSDFSIRIYDAETYQLKRTLSGHSNSVFALSYSKNGRYLISGGRDAMLKVWDVENDFVLLHDITAHTLHINTIVFNPENTLLATGSMDKTIKIWDAKTFKLLKVIDKVRNQSHSTSVNKLLWLDNHRLVSVSDDKITMLWGIKVII
jgi:WD40 repeat protein